jgi:hypothetical protein
VNGHELKEHGQQIALEHAGNDWQTLALDYLNRFLGITQAVPFLFEDFRDYATHNGLPQPASHKAWGALCGAASRRGLIEPTGQVKKAKAAKTHAHRVMEWRRAA